MNEHRSHSAGGPVNEGESYLWDMSGEVDPAVVRLERAAAPLRAGASVGSGLDVSRRPLALARVLAAAACLVLAGAAVLAARRGEPAAEIPPAGSGVRWAVESLAGSPRLGGTVVGDQARLASNQWIVTDPYSRAAVSGVSIGRVTIEPNSKVRLTRTGEDQQRMELAEGKLHAFITAPPRLFVVDTPAATAVDMGCVYDLEARPDGSSVLRVTSGWVELGGKVRTARVPAGYQSSAAKGGEPGVPWREEASAEFRAALEGVEAALGAGGSGEREVEMLLEGVLRAAERSDAATLWHLLTLAPAGSRRGIAERLEEFVSPPEEVTLEGAMAGDRGMLDAWWERVRRVW